MNIAEATGGIVGFGLVLTGTCLLLGASAMLTGAIWTLDLTSMALVELRARL